MPAPAFRAGAGKSNFAYRREAASLRGNSATPAYTRRHNMQDKKKIPSPQEQSSEFQVELHLVTMPGVVVNAWVRPANVKDTSVLMGYTLPEFEC
jgi:hypothetical protein